MIITHILSESQPISFAAMDACVPDIYKTSTAMLEEITLPRILKSHASATELYPSFIYCVRDPRSVCVSYYNYRRRIGSPNRLLTIERFVDLFLTPTLFPFATWQEHVLGWHRQRYMKDRRSLFMKYEDMMSSPERAIGQVAAFLGVSMGVDRLTEIANLTCFTRLRDLERSDSRNWREMDQVMCPDIPFFRDGSAVGWKQVLEPSDRQKIERSYRDVMLAFRYFD